MRARPSTTDRLEADETTSLLLELSDWWWVGGVLFYGLGDTATTVIGLQRRVVAEGSPVVATAMGATGPWAILPLKLLVFAVAYVLWVVVPRPHNVGVPLGLFALGVALTAWNAVVLLATA